MLAPKKEQSRDIIILDLKFYCKATTVVKTTLHWCKNTHVDSWNRRQPRKRAIIKDTKINL